MIKKMNKKGFTLAELLIVVAIIAVLTAIAVPLFVGALDDADKRVGDANVRAVRVAAVNEILLNQDKYDQADHTLKGPWKVTATVSSSGEISEITIVTAELTVTEGSTAFKTAFSKDPNSGDNGYYEKDADGNYTVYVLVNKLAIK